MAEPARRLPPEDRPDIDPDIRPPLEPIHGGGEGNGVPAGDLHAAEEDGAGLYNEDGDQGYNGDGSPGGSANGNNNRSRRSGQPGGVNKESSLYNDLGDEEPSGRFKRAKGAIQSGRGKLNSLKNYTSSNKLFVGIALGGTGIITIIVIALVIFAGAYKLVNFSEHVAAYQFARVTRQMTVSTTSVTTQRIGVDIADNALLNSIKNRYANATGRVSEVWSKFDKYRPNKVIENYGEQGRLKFNYKTTALGRQQLVSVTVGDSTSQITRRAARNLIPGYNFVSGTQFARNFAPNLIQALKADDIGPITRARIASQIRKELGINLEGWIIARFAGKTAVQAQVLEEQLVFDTAEGPDKAVAGGATSSALDDAAKKAADAQDKAVHDPEKIKEIVKNPNQLSFDFEQALDDSIKESSLAGVQSGISGIIRQAVGIINPIYSVATPLCLIYDGSIQKSGPTMNVQSTQQQRKAIHLHSEAGQEKDGFNVTPEAVEAANWKIGDITTSNAERRASGIPVDTSNYASTQASPTGQYSYSLADFLPGPLATGVELADGACPVLTNLWVGVGVGAVNVTLAILSGGGAAAADGATAAAADAAAQQAVPALAKRIIGKVVNAGSQTKEFATSTAKQVTLIGGATLVAKAIVMSKAGAVHNSLATGKPYNDSIDDGTNQYANEIERKQFYGAPLADSELGADNKANRAVLAYRQGQKNAFERYLAVTNPDSLLSRMAITTSGYVNHSVFASIFNAGGSIFNPLRSLSNILGPLVLQHSFAASPVSSVKTYYGNVQTGYTQAELALMSSDASYGLLPNQYALDLSGQEGAIEDKYGACFTKSIPDLLADGLIKRSQDGGVLADDSLCSPKSLGLDNDAYGENMVFRWRVAHNLENTVDMLVAAQEIGPSDDTGGGSGGGAAGGGGSAVSGNAQQLAQQILDAAQAGSVTLNTLNISDQLDHSTPRDNLQQTAAGQPAKTTTSCVTSIRGAQPPRASVNLNTNLLKFILELSKSTPIQINALAGQCHSSSGSNHYKGMAVDFGCPLDQSKADTIGKKYGISDQTGEYCSNSAHFHYSVGGR